MKRFSFFLVMTAICAVGRADGWNSRHTPLLSMAQTLRCSALCLTHLQNKIGDKEYRALKSYKLERKPGEVEFTARWMEEEKEKEIQFDCHLHGKELDCH